MAIVVAARVAPAIVTVLRNLLVTFLGVEAVETVMETVLGLDIAPGEEKSVGRGVLLVDQSTGLVLGRTSRIGAIAHLNGRKRPRVTRITKTIIEHHDDHHGHHEVR